MNTTGIYRIAVEGETTEEKEARLAQLKAELMNTEAWKLWLSATKTQEFIALLNEQKERLLNASMSNPSNASAFLIEASTINKVINLTTNGVYE